MASQAATRTKVRLSHTTWPNLNEPCGKNRNSDSKQGLTGKPFGNQVTFGSITMLSPTDGISKAFQELGPIGIQLQKVLSLRQSIRIGNRAFQKLGLCKSQFCLKCYKMSSHKPSYILGLLRPTLNEFIANKFLLHLSNGKTKLKAAYNSN